MSHPGRIPPKNGQESVWDYPRPPRAERVSEHVWVVVGDVVIADSNDAWRVLETSHPPTVYIPPSDVRMDLLEQAAGSSHCEWKGKAIYYDIQAGDRHIQKAAWAYPTPTGAFSMLKDHLAFYPSRVDACYLDDEQVQAQAGDFYGGWITSKIVGPFKGGPGTWGW